MGRAAKILVAAAALVAVGVFTWRRWGADPEAEAPASVGTREREPDTAAPASPTTQRVANEQGAVPGPEVRELESAETEETRYERLGERESEEREAAAQRLVSDPLTEKLETDA